MLNILKSEFHKLFEKERLEKCVLSSVSRKINFSIEKNSQVIKISNDI